jgi:hypothetical protein
MAKTISFTLNDVEEKALKDFLEQRDKEVLEQQRKTLGDDFDFLTMGGKHPYHGATGGGLTYRYTPTSIGAIVEVTYCGVSKDITDYNSW